MRSITLAIATLLAAAQASASAHDHSAFSRRHAHLHDLFKRHSEPKIVKRGTCAFPKDKGLVPVTPNAQNAGWAMSPDQPCECGKWCPYACPPGQLMAQWNPDAKTYSYPESMDGGLYCNDNGEVEKPFPNKPYCYDGTGSVEVENKAGASVSFCQTVLPGNEAMLIPTCVKDKATLAVPDTSYWAGTAAHYYINPPGVSDEEACVWGTKDKPVGNWSPYVAGANAADNGETFVKLGWNPIYIEPDVKFRDVVPDFGVRIECDGDCAGLPCEIDPAKHKVNECSKNNPAGAGGATFCVVGVPKGSKARIVVFGGSGEKPKTEKPKPKPKPEEENEENANEDEKEVVTSSSSYVAPSTKATSSKTTTSLSVTSSTAAPSTSSAEETSSSSSSSSSSADYSLVYEEPSHTTLEKVVVASATGSSAVPTNGTVSYPSEAPPTKSEPASSANTAAIPSFALLFTIACYTALFL